MCGGGRLCIFVCFLNGIIVNNPTWSYLILSVNPLSFVEVISVTSPDIFISICYTHLKNMYKNYLAFGSVEMCLTVQCSLVSAVELSLNCNLFR